MKQRGSGQRPGGQRGVGREHLRVGDSAPPGEVERAQYITAAATTALVATITRARRELTSARRTSVATKVLIARVRSSRAISPPSSPLWLASAARSGRDRGSRCKAHRPAHDATPSREQRPHAFPHLRRALARWRRGRHRVSRIQRADTRPTDLAFVRRASQPAAIQPGARIRSTR